MESVRQRKSCRVCHSEKLFQYLDLGNLPLANSYLTPKQAKEPEFKAPLAVRLCENCGLSQLSHVVDPSIMFSNYLYVSSTPKTFRDHCDGLAIAADELLCGISRKFVLDIASNDGCLLRSFKKIGYEILGVDPAKNLAQEANNNGVPTICDFWSKRIAEEIVDKHGSPTLITATNVFAHVDDVHGFLDAVTTCLDTKGIFILEFPYLLDFLRHNLFDTIYHEHLSYFALQPIYTLMKEYDMEIIDVIYFPDIHGGSIRVISARKGRFSVGERVPKTFRAEEEFGILSRKPYLDFSRRVRTNKAELVKFIQDAKMQGERIWGYGASAKGNTLLNYFGITNELVERIIDDNPKKWGYLTPGTRIPISGIDALKESREKVDALLLLAWNFAEEIKSRAAAVGYSGSFIYPVPTPRRILGKVKSL